MKPLREGTPAADVGAVLQAVGPADRWTPMLDWTSRGMARVFCRTGPSFRPVEPDAAALPYLDHTIEVVLIDNAERIDEAARVAAGTVVLVTTDDAGELVGVDTRHIRSERPAGARTCPDPGCNRCRGRVARAGERSHRRTPGLRCQTGRGSARADLRTDAATLVMAERGVLPLPGCIEAAERLLASDPRVGGVAVKLLDADGVLEAAGGAAFADGSIAAIAQGAPATAPWHEYVRPVATAVGLVVLRPAAARQCAGVEAGTLDLAARLGSPLVKRVAAALPTGRRRGARVSRQQLQSPRLAAGHGRPAGTAAQTRSQCLAPPAVAT